MLRRLPSWTALARVYAVIVMLVYGWTILRFLWQVPSWLHFLNLGELVTLLSYAFSVNLLESVLVLGGLVLLGVLLPATWFTEKFTSRGTALVVCGLGAMMYIATRYASKADYPDPVLGGVWLAVAGALILAVVMAAGRIAWLRKAIELFADHATIFLYPVLPLSAMALLMVLVGMVR